jgi:UDP-GlcNAc:undecaprenyl-phosphate GlcNAc-1-phosphate transferase
METLLAIIGISFGVGVVLVPLARRLALGCNLVDRPDARRKLHGRVIPVAGGLAVLASTCLVVTAALLIPGDLQQALLADSGCWLGLLLASVWLAALGVLDDFNLLRGRHKLLGQVGAVCIVMGFGTTIERLGIFGWEVDLGNLALPFTLLWLLGAINALNLIDGMDGMLGCVGLIITLAMAGMALLGGHWAAACVAVALAGSLLAFLCYNFPPASVFMGDAGSMAVGLAIGVLGIKTSLKGPATVALIAPTVVLTIPFFDTFAAIVRRKLTGRSIYTTDRGHLHHCLLSRGFSAPAVLGWVALFCLMAAAGALASIMVKNELVAVCALVTVTAILITTRLFGYAEFLLVKRRFKWFLLSFLQTRGQSQEIEVHLHGKAAWKALKDVVTARGFDLNLQSVRLNVSAPALHEEYTSQWHRFDEDLDCPCWRVDLPLSLDGRFVGHLDVSGYLDADPVWAKVAELTRLVEGFRWRGVNVMPRQAPAWRPDGPEGIRLGSDRARSSPG